jgi:hypothetical protein
VSLLSEIERMLRQGREQATRSRDRAADIADAVRRQYGNRVEDLERELALAFDRGARAGQRQAGLDRLGRTLTNPDASDAYTRQRALDLLTDMAAEQRRVLAVVDAYSRRWGLSPARRLDVLRAAGGLNWRQAQALLRQRDRMADNGVPTRQLRTQMVAYGDRLRLQRARTIARTEAQVAANVGQEAVWRAGQGAGLISSRARRVWVTALDERTCPTCSALDGVSVALDEPWDAGGVAVATPGAVHPHCRCSEELVGAYAKAA